MSVLDARSGALLRGRRLALAPKALAVDERTGHILVAVAPPTRPSNVWGWLPFIPPPAPSDQVVTLDEGTLDMHTHDRR